MTESVTEDFGATTITFPNSTQTGPVDFQSLLGGTTGYVGFTGATGGSTSTQTVSNFTFQDFVNGSVASGNTWTNPITATTGTTSGIEVGMPAANGSLTVSNINVQSGER